MPEFVLEFGRGADEVEADGRLDAPAFHRNCEPIRAVLEPLLRGRAGDVLEVGSGTGQHAVALARAFEGLRWWPSDPSPRHRLSIDAWRRASGLANLEAAIEIDAAGADWGLGEPGEPPACLAAILCINVLHISPWAVTEGLIAGAARHLGPGGWLVIYGPFARGGVHTAPSNAAFDGSLRAQDPAWGVRDLDDVTALAMAACLQVLPPVPMPANNMTLVFGRPA
jgi:SAM-dependent methyltransferase